MTGNPASKSVLVEECNKQREEGSPGFRNHSTFGNREKRDESSDEGYVDDEFESSKKESHKESLSK